MNLYIARGFCYKNWLITLLVFIHPMSDIFKYFFFCLRFKISPEYRAQVLREQL